MTQLNDEQRAFLMKFKADLRKGNLTKLLKELGRQNLTDKRAIMCYMLEHGVPVLSNMTTLSAGFIDGIDIAALIIPGNIKRIGREGIAEGQMKELIFEEGVEELASKSIARCPTLQKVTLPNSLRNLQTATFFRCPELKEVFIPDSIRVLPKELFFRCSDELVVLANFRDSKETRLKCVDSERDWYRHHLKWIKGGE